MVDLPPRRLALVRKCVVAIEIDVRDDHGGLDVLTLAGAVTGEQTQGHRRGVPGRSHGVGTGFGQRRVAFTRLVDGGAGEGGDDGVDGGLTAVGTGRAVGRPVLVDQVRVDVSHGLVVDAEGFGDTRPEAVHEDVGLGHEAVQDLPASFVLEIECDALLALHGADHVVVPEVQHRVRAAVGHPVRITTEKPVRVALQALDLDDPCPQIRQQGGGERRGVVVRALDDGDTVQRDP